MMHTLEDQCQFSVSLSPNWNEPLQVGTKRFLDVTISLLLMILLSPMLLLFAVLIKLASPGPVFYPWRVVGKNGRPFVGFKFRSMVVDADELKAELAKLNEMSGPVFKLTNDPRITPIGRWLRRYSLDELPQLYSVFMGDMSLVGPRPPLQTEYAQFTTFQKQKLSVKPGMTCLWQIQGRTDINDFADWIQLDLEYIKRWSLALDLKILVRTASVVVNGSGK
jgi:lipopolysaccharide/colanic/teichoic acid biosynthesis glycosyltransferase